MPAPTIMFTAVNTDGVESEPFIWDGSDNVDATNIDVIRLYINSDKEIVLRLNFRSADIASKFRSGMYARLTGSSATFNSYNISYLRNRVMRFIKSHIPNNPPPANHGDYIIRGNFIRDSTTVAVSTISSMGIKLASPLFSDTVIIEDDIETPAVENPTEFTWKLPRLEGVDHYVMYALSSNDFFHEVDTTTEQTYRIGKNETFRSLGSIPLGSGRKYHIGTHPFRSPGNYPSIVSFYKQRKVFANTINDPDTFWFSRVGDYGNFLAGTDDDDAIEVTLASNTVDAVTHIIPLGDMFVLTEGSTWVLRNQGPLTPANISFQKAGNVGSPRRQDPYIVDGLLLFTPTNRKDIVQAVFDYETESYSLHSATTIARHLFTDRVIRDVSYVGDQHPFLGITLESNTGLDNTLLIAVFNRRDDIVAWSPWTTEDGRFNQVLPDPAGNGLYFLIRRNLTGGTSSLRIEKFDPSYTTFTDTADALMYPFEVKTIPLEGDNGVSITDSYTVSDIYLKLNNAQTFNTGIDIAEKTIDKEMLFSGTERIRVESDWDRDSSVIITDTSANPLEILAIAVEGRIQKKEANFDIPEQPQPQPEQLPSRGNLSAILDGIEESYQEDENENVQNSETPRRAYSQLGAGTERRRYRRNTRRNR